MDRNTIIAIVLCVVVIAVGMTIQTTFFSAPTNVVESVDNAGDNTVYLEGDSVIPASSSSVFKAIGRAGPAQSFTVSNDSLTFTFDPIGATISSIKMSQHKDKGEDLELIFKDSDDDNAFMLYYGGDKSAKIDCYFDHTIEEKTLADGGRITQVTFTQDFENSESGQKFTIEKRFAIPQNSEYMIQLAVTVKTPDGKAIPLNDGNGMYTISVGPQIGPYFDSLSGNYEYRRVIYKQEGKGSRKNASFNKSGSFKYDKPVDWIGLTGKYFAFLMIPETDSIVANVSANQITNNSETLPQEDVFYLTRKSVNASSVTDIYSFYAGPQTAKSLKIYDRAQDNIFGVSNYKLEKALDVSWLSWLETILKWILEALYFVIPNYGVAIILLTIAIKLCLVPISKKSLDSTAKMSALTPKIDEIKEKYKDDPEAQNKAIAKLYQDEKINPMGSCIPMLIQFPILIALYGLLNKNFELRGAMFIPGWIPDLSVPDTIATLPFSLPLLGNKIHLLPIIYTVSMIFSMKITQTTNTNQSQKGMMLFMTYGMPIMFFFILYNAPAGLLVYWTIANAISIIQQVWTNKKKGGIYAAEIKQKDEAKQAKKQKKKR